MKSSLKKIVFALCIFLACVYQSSVCCSRSGALLTFVAMVCGVGSPDATKPLLRHELSNERVFPHKNMTPGQFCVVSLNMRYPFARDEEDPRTQWGSRLPVIADMLAEAGCEVVALQEAIVPSLRALNAELVARGLDYEAVVPHLQKGSEAACVRGLKSNEGEHLCFQEKMVLLLAKTRFKLVKNFWGSLGGIAEKISLEGVPAALKRAPVHFICVQDRVTGALGFFLNTHFPSAAKEPSDLNLRKLAALVLRQFFLKGEDAAYHGSQMLMPRESQHNKAFCIIAMDGNLFPDLDGHDAYRLLTADGLDGRGPIFYDVVDASREGHYGPWGTNPPGWPTDKWFSTISPEGSRIDFIGFRGPLEVVREGTLAWDPENVAGSDHLALIAVFKYRD